MTARGWDTFIMVDWSGGNDRGPKPKADAIWTAVARGATVTPAVYHRNRQVAEAWLADFITAERTAGRRVMVGFDFPFGYPAGFCRALTGSDDPLALWDWIEARVEDSPKANNRFDLAARINAMFGGRGPFWGNALRRDLDGLPRTKTDYENPFPDRREAENRARGAFTLWQLAGAGAVGSQTLMGLPVLARLRRLFGADLAVWPFQPLDQAGIAFVEIWPSLTLSAPPIGVIKDAWQVERIAATLAGLAPSRLDEMLDVTAPEEGWIFGLGFEDTLHPPLQPPPLTNDCFALPAGVAWTPVDEALRLLRDRLTPITGVQQHPLSQAPGRILAAPVTACRANPPRANTAVDGYGFTGPMPAGPHEMPLVKGRAAAGADFAGSVPHGHAVRILTGAALPPGVDTVILQEDVTTAPDRIAFNGPVKQGANTRNAAEDVAAGDEILPLGRRVTPADMALLAATGCSALSLRAPLRVGVLSTGDELAEAGTDAAPDQIYDANRPMLLSLVTRMGHVAVDLGRAPDDRAALRACFDDAAARVDAIVTSGGASSGDEDHVSALLQSAGAMSLWRIAVKPGRPLALGMWQGTPVFGLPGNPVAAMVCTLIFARPALGVLAGEGWLHAQGFDVPAAFEKSKKPGRREFLRARIRQGRAEVFASEGSGRISGLSWAEGLVELPDAAVHVRPGDPVRYLPFSSFGI